MDFYSAFKESDIMKFAGKWVELGKKKKLLIVLSQSEKYYHYMYSLVW